MHRPTQILVVMAAGAALSAGTASAETAHHPRHHRFVAARANGGGEPYGYRNAPYPQAYGGYYGAGGYAGGWEAAANARATAQAYRDPGVTLELAPDAKETATGGPVGGVPGFSGH